MQKRYFYYIVLFISLLNTVYSQAPVINPIGGPANVCSSPTNPMTYSVFATNSPTAYAWSVVSPGGVVISNPTMPLTTISFPYSAGTYTIYCSASNGFGSSPTVSFVVTVFETPTVTFSGANSFCQGSSTSLQASSTILMASPTINYSWTPGYGLNVYNLPNVVANPSVTTVYTVTATKGICTNSSTVQITKLAPPTVSTNPNYTMVCIGNTVSLMAIGANTISWSDGILNGVAFTPTVTKTYTANGINPNGCSDTALATIVVDLCTSINQMSNKLPEELLLYPNPNSGDFILKSGTNIRAIITNELGEVVREIYLQAGEETKINDLTCGIYFVITPSVKRKVIVTR